MKNRYTILLLIVGVGIMLAMLYFIGLEDVLSALAMSNLYLVRNQQGSKGAPSNGNGKPCRKQPHP